MPAKGEIEVDGSFGRSRGLFEELAGWLDGDEAGGLTHGELEEQMLGRGRALVRQLAQDHVDLRAMRERPLGRGEVIDAEGVEHRNVEKGLARNLTTVFGSVTVARMAYRCPGAANLYPADARFNLPVETYSHGLRRLAAVEATRGCYDGAAEAVARCTGVRLGKRQLGELVGRAAVDVDAFYTARTAPTMPDQALLLLTADGKGVVVRREAMRAGAARATPSRKLSARLSKGEKLGRKRMAELGSVYDALPAVRTPADIIASATAEADGEPACAEAGGPVAVNKWLTASLASTADDVIDAVFAEATRRDPEHRRRWVALVDGNNQQIRRIKAQAAAHHIDLPIIVDLVHVIEYLWKAAWCFYPEGDPAAQTWVADHATAILEGRAGIVAAAIRRKATTNKLSATKRKPADTAANYLLAKKPYLDYPTALANGWPVATGIIEGACRHIVKDRMDITGARWGLDGAEAILKLRTVISNGDLDAYWTYHLNQEQHQVHRTRYLANIIPQ